MFAESLICLYKTGVLSFEVIETRFISGICALASNRTLHRPEWIIKIGAIWFLNALFLANIFAKPLVKLKSPILQIGITIGMFLLLAYLTHNYLIPFGINYGIAFIFWLLIGYYCKKKDFFCSIRITKRIACVIFALWGGIILMEQLTKNQYNICWIKLPLFGVEWVGAVCGILSIYIISSIIKRHYHKIYKALIYIGENSIWILCVHALSIELLSLNGYVHTVLDIAVALEINYLYKIKKKKYVNRTKIMK